MMARNSNSYTYGTAALKMPRWVQAPDEATIIVFPTSRMKAEQASARCNPGPQALPAERRGVVGRVLESSEMYSSLRLESFLGCPYNVFTGKGIAALSVGAAVIGAVSLILGA